MRKRRIVPFPVVVVLSLATAAGGCAQSPEPAATPAPESTPAPGATPAPDAEAAPAARDTAPGPAGAVAPMLPYEDPNALVREAYRLISGPADEPRDWDAFRRLFAPGARLAMAIPPERMPADSLAAGSRPAMYVMTVEDYIRVAGPGLERSGFHERELGSVTERYGRVAHVFSSYVSTLGSHEGDPIDHGVNSFQLIQGDGRWWIFTILWDSKSRGAGPIPERYLD